MKDELQAWPTTLAPLLEVGQRWDCAEGKMGWGRSRVQGQAWQGRGEGRCPLGPSAQLFSQKKLLQATVRAATSTTYSWKSTSPSPFSSSSFITLSTASASFWACEKRRWIVV